MLAVMKKGDQEIELIKTLLQFLRKHFYFSLEATISITLLLHISA